MCRVWGQGNKMPPRGVQKVQFLLQFHFSSLTNMLNRGTYFCPRCQDNREQMVAKKGSLLGWATTSSTPTRPTWQCGTCTLENKGIDITCAACGSKAQSQSNPSTTSWDCSACTLTNKAGNLTCAACGGPRQEGQENKWAGFGKGLKRKRENEDDQGTTMARGKVLGSKRDLTLNDSKTINDNNQQPAKMRGKPGGNLSPK